jgi:hypothetical protein
MHLLNKNQFLKITPGWGSWAEISRRQRAQFCTRGVTSLLHWTQKQCWVTVIKHFNWRLLCGCCPWGKWYNWTDVLKSSLPRCCEHRCCCYIAQLFNNVRFISRRYYSVLILLWMMNAKWSRRKQQRASLGHYPSIYLHDSTQIPQLDHLSFYDNAINQWLCFKGMSL